MFGTVCWRLCLGQCDGDYVWDSVLAIMFGTVCWRLCLGQCVGDYVWDSVMAIMFGTVCWLLLTLEYLVASLLLLFLRTEAGNMASSPGNIINIL